MKLALAFLAALALTHAAVDINTIQPYYYPHHPHLRLSSSVATDSFRIVGGQEVEPHSLPYQVALVYYFDRSVRICGGSLVSPTTVLTAARCVDKIRKVLAFFGKHDLRNPSGTHLPVDKIIVHPAWNRERVENDIAILRFDREIELNERIKIVKLPSRADISNDFAGEMAIASGWSRYSLAHSTVLQSVNVSVITNEECNQIWGDLVQPTQICTSTADGKSPTGEDAGGPLVANGKQIGIISFGCFNCEIETPFVSTRITEYIDWIERNSDIVFD